MKTSDFDFDLPATAIAQRPAEPRDAARLLHVGPDLRDLHVLDLPSLLNPGDVLMVNDTRVVPTRLRGHRGDAPIEVTLHKHLPGGGAHDLWLAFARPAKKLQPGNDVRFADGLTATVEAKGLGGEVTLRFPLSHADLLAALNRVGIMPLPPYIKRPAEGDARDAADYQTRFAARDGAVAAPTAGLHFTERLTAAVEAQGAAIHRLTLHVGAGTFLPVKTEDLAQHKMHAEWGEVTAATAAAVNAAKARGGRVVAVGTTALRLLETAADTNGKLHPFVGETDIFILPGYRFKIVDRLMTNFHLPKSTLFMLVSAFAGLERMKAAYAHALKTGYRFYSYGDACLLERAP